ncbi:hypothetical protein INT43_005986 [Umbelopsis isabellina]|uniref:DH domain-containing protein n=1 Tax=Mortierella isabellina TaxID=91625 RepID=A0A8H7UCX3_MORIS|nr:hypothetical protein INT43_005986 [Umbelopsis isabellina]
MDVLSNMNSGSAMGPEVENAATRRAYANFQYSWSKRTMLALVDTSHTSQRLVQRQLSMSENSSTTSCDMNSETSTECTTPNSTYQTQEDQVFQRKQSIKRTYAFNELIDTERVYVNDLRMMVENYFIALKNQEWMNEEDWQLITRNINAILKLHVKLLSKLEACSNNFHWENIHNRYCQIADVFITMGPEFMIYADFCGLHSQATKTYASYQSRPEWISFSKMCLNGMELTSFHDDLSATTSPGTRLHLEDYLIKPVQRICRYQLLINEILKSTDAAAPEYEKLKTSFQIMQGVVTVVDDRKNQRDLSDRSHLFLERLEEDWRLTKSFVASLGNLTMSGALEVTYAEDSTPPTKTRYMGCFLYSNYMIIVKGKKQNSYEARHWFPINIFEVKDLPMSEGCVPFSFMLTAKEHIFEFAASCEQEKQLWLKALSSNILLSQQSIDESSKIVKVGRFVPISFYFKSNQTCYALRPSKSHSNMTFDSKDDDASSAPIRRSRSITVESNKSLDQLMFAAGYQPMTLGDKPGAIAARRSSVDHMFRSRSLLKRADTMESNYTIELLSTSSPPNEPMMQQEIPPDNGSESIEIKRISQMRMAQQYSIKIAIDQRFNDVCTQDYLSSRAWNQREKSTLVTLKKRKSLPFISTSNSTSSLASVNARRRTSDVGHIGRRGSMEKQVNEMPLEDYVAFQKSLVNQRSEASRRPSLTCQAIRNNWSRVSGAMETKVDDLADSDILLNDEIESNSIAPWENSKVTQQENEADYSISNNHGQKSLIQATLEKLDNSMAKPTVERCKVGTESISQFSELVYNPTKSESRRMSKTLQFCKPKRAISAPLASKSTRSLQRSQRSSSLLIPKATVPVPLTEVPRLAIRDRFSTPPPARRVTIKANVVVEAFLELLNNTHNFTN